jgi:hypothetical protein
LGLRSPQLLGVVDHLNQLSFLPKYFDSTSRNIIGDPIFSFIRDNFII